MPPMNRRDMLKLTSITSMATLASAAPKAAHAAIAASEHAPVPKWELFEVTLHGPAEGNPFVDGQLTATFVLGHRTLSVDGFYDGHGVYKLRFMPDAEGEWSYATVSNVPALNGNTGKFVCSAPLAGAHGPVSVRNTHHFAHADGTPFFPFGTTCYAWIHQGEDVQRETLEVLRDGPFNKIRMCVFPKSYEYNHNEPPFYPFERSAAGVNDYTRPNPAFFAHVEQRIADLRAIGVEADLILFHPYDRWGYQSMPAETDDLYLRYVLARMSAFPNIWWSLANEWDLMKAKSVQDFDRFFHIIEQHNPVPHLRSIHYSQVMYDNTRPWVTHASLQSSDFAAAEGWLKTWGKPICYDEVKYEGNFDRRWGNLSGEEMTRRFWLGVVAGCYVTHGETYLDPNLPIDENSSPTIPWSHGGKLRGSSPARIGFLRKLVESSGAALGKAAKRTGFDAQPNGYYFNASMPEPEGKDPEVILYYFDDHQPLFYEFPLPAHEFTAEVIDPWAMTVTAVPGTFKGKSKIRLPARPYQAVRFLRVRA
ncbi:MAG TPA: DUF5060 domain-containing protein [Acidobacteriaceae bacterium]